MHTSASLLRPGSTLRRRQLLWSLLAAIAFPALVAAPYLLALRLPF